MRDRTMEQRKNAQRQKMESDNIIDMPVNELPFGALQMLSLQLGPNWPNGPDWRSLARILDCKHEEISLLSKDKEPVLALLKLWVQRDGSLATTGKLLAHIRGLERHDIYVLLDEYLRRIISRASSDSGTTHIRGLKRHDTAEGVVTAGDSQIIFSRASTDSGISTHDEEEKIQRQKYRAKHSHPASSGSGIAMQDEVSVHSEEFRSRMKSWKKKAEKACLSSERIDLFELAAFGKLGSLDRPLQTLDFSGLGIESWQLTSEFSPHEALSLDFSGNNIDRIPKEFLSRLDNVRQLKFTSNKVTKLPVKFGETLKNLEQLDLRCNQIYELPDDFGKCFEKLVELDLSRNNLIELPDDFGKLFLELQRLDLGGNGLLSLPKEFGSCLRKLKQLVLNGNKLSELPSDFVKWFPELQRLDLSDNELTSLPSRFGSCLEYIQELNLIDLQENDLNSLPRAFGQCMQRLVKLDLSKNKLYELPNDFSEWFPELISLYLQDNELKSLPEGFGSCLQRLAWLDLSGNKIEFLPVNFGKGLSSLMSLNLENNEISTLPTRVKELNSLVYIEGNPIANSSYHIGKESFETFQRHSSEEDYEIQDEMEITPSLKTTQKFIAAAPSDISVQVSEVVKWHPYEDLPLFQVVNEITEELADPDLKRKVYAVDKRLPVTREGGIFVCDYLGISLDIPMNALHGSTVIELSEKPIDEVHIDLEFGESCLSHVISLGPDDVRFSKPCKLTIPYNLYEKPSMTKILVKHFVSSHDKWGNLSANIVSKSSEDGKLIKKLAQVEIQETGLYAVCLVLESVRFTVFSDESLSLYPFGEDIGVKLRFQSDTFQREWWSCTTKVNVFTDEAVMALRSRGITTSPILHVETSSDLPKKPVEVKLPFQQIDGDEGNIFVLQGNNDVFEDITDSSNYELEDNSVIVQVHHFSLILVVRSIVSDFLDVLKTYVSGACDAAFYLYGIKDEPELSCRIASSLFEDNEKVNEFFKNTPFTFIDKCQSSKGLYCGTELMFDVLGQMRSNFLIERFSFSRQKLCVTETFTLVEKNQEQEQGVPEENYIDIVGRDDGIKYAKMAYWRLLQNRKTDIRQPVVLIKQEYHLHEQHQHEHKHEHKHENKIENKIDFTTHVHDGSTAIVGEIKADIKDPQVLQIANFGAQIADQQGRALEIRDSTILEIEPKND